MGRAVGAADMRKRCGTWHSPVNLAEADHYGLRDDEYLRLKVLTCMLPPL